MKVIKIRILMFAEGLLCGLVLVLPTLMFEVLR